MNIRYNARTWHGWIAVCVALPILVVALTAILIAHSGPLGLRDIKLDAAWLPGYAEGGAQDPWREARSVLALGDELWIGTRAGLVHKSPRGLETVAAFDGQEVRALVAGAGGPLVLTQQGLWAQRQGEWKRAGRGPVQSVFAADGAIYAVFRDKGLQVSQDGGRNWQPADAVSQVLAALPAATGAAPLPLARVVRDLHSGAALFGHDGEWIWIDLIAGAMTFLAGTGIYLWCRGRRRRGRARSATPANHALSSATR